MALETGMLALKQIGAEGLRKSIDISERIEVRLLGHADSWTVRAFQVRPGERGGEGERVG